MKKFLSTIDYIFTLTITIFHIIFVLITMNLSAKANIEALATSYIYQKILLIITIIYLVIFIFLGNPIFYKSKIKRRFKMTISFIKNIIYILNSIFIIQIAFAACSNIDLSSNLSLFDQIIKLNEALKNFGLSGFYVFYMVFILMFSIIRLIIFAFQVLLYVVIKVNKKNKIKDEQALLE